MKKLLFSLFIGLFSWSAFADVDFNLVNRAEKYLNSITGLSGNFIQVANKKKQHGTFAMLRPGRVRLDYNDMPVQLIADGKDLYFFDKSLDQITTVPLTSTPAGILIRKQIDLKNSDINVVETKSEDKSFSLKINLKGQEGLGYMTVVFNKTPIKLNSWSVVDATGTQTDVSFDDLKLKTDFGKNYFQIQRHKMISTGSDDSFYD